MTRKPKLTFDADPRAPESACVRVDDIQADLIGSLNSGAQSGVMLRSALRVRIVASEVPGGGELPDVCGRYQVLQNGLRFIPHFPFEAGARFRATFDPRQLGRPAVSEVLTLEFSLPKELSAGRAQVKHVFPSSDSLPENLLRFYVCFSSPMQRGRAQQCITLLGSDGKPEPDVLYRPPVELWDSSMRCLTVLLDPGRLKRGVGPNRELGPPLSVGHRYTVVIDPGMVDMSGSPLCEAFCKTFTVTEAVRHRVEVEQWKIMPPMAESHQPLVLLFPKPLDWAQLWRAITISSEDGQLMDGRIAVDQSERRWSFTPISPWTSGSYYVRVVSNLEDVCGNSLQEAFDRSLRTAGDLGCEMARRSIAFHV